MRARGLVRIPTALALTVAASLLSASAWADALMCQARGGTEFSPPPVDAAFYALAAGGVPPYAFHWEFGDGGSSADSSAAHTYLQSGFYLAILTVSDALSQACFDTVAVHPGIAVDPICVAAADQRWGDHPLPVQFSGYPVFVEPGPYTWTWNLGDGTTVDWQSPLHVYDIPGTYWAALTLHTPYADHECGTVRLSALWSARTGVDPDRGARRLRLEPPRPNPSWALTAIGFELPRPGRARLEILDLSGRSIATLVDGYREAGRHVGVWQGRSRNGGQAPCGIYFARLDHGGAVKSARIVRLGR